MQIQKRRSQKVQPISSIIQELKQYGQLNLRDMSSLLLKISDQLRNQPNMLSLSTPLLIVGDIHGQFYDLLNLLDKYGSPEQKQILFLGDYVDRGSFSIQVITLLFTFKLRFPNNIHLLRGNHECRALTSIFNFKEQCLAKYNQTIYEEIMTIFDSLPICALIDKKYFAVHGGISPNCKTIKQIQSINRFKEIPIKGELCDFLWSDPLNIQMDSWRPNQVRQCSYYFGIDQAKNFLNRNGLKLIIRGHEVQKEGFKYQKNHNVPLTLTIFSAPNYGDVYKNKGCIAQLSNETLQLHTFKQVEHPVVLPNFQNAIEWTLPFVSSCVHHFCKNLLMLQNGKINKKLQEIMINKDKFKEDLRALETVKLIDSILSIEVKQPEQTLPTIQTENSSPDEEQDKRQSFDKKKRQDSKEKMPSAHVIGPKIVMSNNKLKQLESSDEQDLSLSQDSSLDFSLKVLGPTSASIQKLV